MISAGLAAQGVAAVLGHLGAHRRHLAHLMALRLRVVTPQLAATPDASGGPKLDEVTHLFGRQEPPGTPLMAGLAAALAPLRLAPRL